MASIGLTKNQGMARFGYFPIEPTGGFEDPPGASERKTLRVFNEKKNHKAPKPEQESQPQSRGEF
jgi:hypothetical protein